MALELEDFERSYVKRGGTRGLFNVARADEDSAGLRFYGYQNECGSYVIQRMTTSGTLKIYEYYGLGKRPTQFASDWTNRASLTYVEYYQLFPQE